MVDGSDRLNGREAMRRAWDYSFHTFYVSTEREVFQVGRGDGEENPHSTLRKFYVDPPSNSLRQLIRSFRPSNSTDKSKTIP